MACYNTLLLSLLFLSISPFLSSAVNDNPDIHVHFYMHLLPNRTEVLVAKSDIPVPGSFYNFGSVVVVDNPLTDGPNITSAQIGKAQGVMTVMDSLTVVWSANIMFTSGQYNGSYVTFVGPDDITQVTREVAVVGGSGYFRRAQGYISIKTYSVDLNNGDAEIEVDLFVYPAK